MNWIAFCGSFLAINLDFFLLLVVLLTNIRWATVALAYLTGIISLIALSWLIAHTLATYFAEWQLGLLGLIPLWMALHDNDSDNVTTNTRHPFWLVLLVFYGSCTSCNLGLFIPIFTAAPISTLVIISLFCIPAILLFVYVASLLKQSNHVKNWLTRYAEVITRFCFAAVGVFVFFDSGLCAHLWKVLMDYFIH